MSPLLLGGLSKVTLPGLALAIVYALLTGLNEEASEAEEKRSYCAISS